jgi:hypothetical protein
MTAVTGPLLRSRQSRHFVIVTSTFTEGLLLAFPAILRRPQGDSRINVPAAVPVMPIAQFLDDPKFDPETKRVVGVAFEIARVDLANEMIAKRIIELAKTANSIPIFYVKPC